MAKRGRSNLHRFLMPAATINLGIIVTHTGAMLPTGEDWVHQSATRILVFMVGTALLALGLWMAARAEVRDGAEAA